jgi:WD40 repeat protein
MQESRHDAFISYSHGASGVLARGIQNGLQAFAKPWWRRRSMNVFRDETNLAANPDLWGSIIANLDAAAWFVLVSSPEAASSKWVKREVRHWLGEADVMETPPEELDRPIAAPDPERARRMVFVLASGTIAWHERKGELPDFDWTGTTALPKCLAGVFTREPLWIDFSRAVATGAGQRGISLRNPEFQSGIARIYSGIKQVDLADLIGEDARQHRRTMRTAWSAMTTLGLLATAAGVAAWLAFLAAAAADKQRQIAEADRQTALAQSLMAQGPGNLVEAGRGAIEAYRSMVSLSQSSTAPSWLVEWLEMAGLSASPLLGQIVQANRYDADFGRLQPAVDVVRAAEQLLPASLFRVRTVDVENASFVALPEGDLIVSQNFGNALHVREIGAGEPPRTNIFDVPTSRINGIRNIAFSADGRFAAYETADDGIVRIIDVVSGAMVGRVDPNAVFSTAAFDPPAPDMSDTGPITEVFVAGEQAGEPRLAGLALNADGSRLLLISRGGNAVLLAAPDGSPVEAEHAIDASSLRGVERLSEIALDPAAGKVAIATSSNVIGSVPVAVLSTRDGKAAYPALVHSGSVDALGFSADGAWLATGTSDGWAYVWNAGTGAREQSFDVDAAVMSLAFGRGASAGLLLIGTDQGLARLYDVASGRELARLPHPGRVRAVAWGQDGQRVATGGGEEFSLEPVRIWTIADMMTASSARMRPRYSISVLASAQGRVAGIGWPSSLHVWDYRSGGSVMHFPEADVARLPLAFPSTGDTVTAVADEDEGVALVFDIATGKRRTIEGPGLTTVAIEGRESFLGDAAFDPAGKVLARAVQGMRNGICRIELWDLASRAVFDQADCIGKVGGIAIDAAGGQQAWLDSDDTPRVVLRDIASRTTRWAVPLGVPPSGYPVGTKIGFDRKGERLAVGGKETIMVFDTADGSIRARIEPTGADVINLGMNDAGTRVAISSPDRMVRVFDVTTGRLVQRMPYSSDTLGSGGLVFSQDGERLLAAFADDNPGNPAVWQWYVEPDVMVERLAQRLAPLMPDQPIAKGRSEPESPR